MKLLGLHHVTAITSDSKLNHHFYTKILMMRLVKKTVNFDDPRVYHLYYADKNASTGSLMTFFGYEGSHKGVNGEGSAYKVGFSIPKGSLKEYEKNIKLHNYPYQIKDNKLQITDPDGLELELEESDVKDIKISKIYAYSVNDDFYDFLSFKNYELPDGFKFIMNKSNKTTVQGAGSIHHVALAIKNSTEQVKFRLQLLDNNIHVSPVMERFYFKSIYFPDPTGLLLEVATDGPGMHIDEDDPGKTLVLPKWLENQREQIKKLLPSLK
ncbi:MAG: hypothetical protein ACMXX9_02505 [Candidatus Woesearchaeota archaeon]